MVVLFSNRKSVAEKEISEILLKHGASYISDRKIYSGCTDFSVVSVYKKIDIDLKCGIAVMLDDTERFEGQHLIGGVTGICEENNKSALSILSRNAVPTISCGINGKNTVTISSTKNASLLVTLQRSILDCNFKKIEPQEYPIQLTKSYLPFSVMSAAVILLFHNIKPEKF